MRNAAEAIKYNHAFRKYIDTILSKCPEEYTNNLRRNDDYVDYNEQDKSIPSEKALIRMHLNVITVRHYDKITIKFSAIENQYLAELSSLERMPMFGVLYIYSSLYYQ